MSQVKPRVYKGYTLPPGLPEPKNPIALIKRILDVPGTLNAAREYGDISICIIRPLLTYAVYNPELLREVLEDYWDAVVRGSLGFPVVHLAGLTLLTSDGERHRQLRDSMEPAFHHEVVEGLAPAMTHLADTIQAQWVEGVTIDLKETMEDIGLRMVVRSMFGPDLKDDSVFHPMVAAASAYIHSPRALMPPWMANFMYKVPTPLTNRTRRAIRDFRSIYADLFADYRAAEDRGEKKGMLSLLLAGYDPKTGDQLTEAEVRSEFFVSMLTAHHILGITMMWAWHSMAIYPEAADKVYAEIDAVLGDRLPTLEDFWKLKATRQFVLESLRLSPAFYVTTKITNREINIAGYDVPKGAQIIIPVLQVNRDPRWWDEAEEFKPERWTDGSQKSPMPYTFMGFLSNAPVGCPADHYAMLVMTLSLATLGRRWRMRMPDGFQPKASHFFNRSVKGEFPMILEQRTGK